MDSRRVIVEKSAARLPHNRGHCSDDNVNSIYSEDKVYKRSASPSLLDDSRSQYCGHLINDTRLLSTCNLAPISNVHCHTLEDTKHFAIAYQLLHLVTNFQSPGSVEGVV